MLGAVFMFDSPKKVGFAHYRPFVAAPPNKGQKLPAGWMCFVYQVLPLQHPRYRKSTVALDASVMTLLMLLLSSTVPNELPLYTGADEEFTGSLSACFASD